MKHILILMTDQLRPDALGAYGNPYVQTPALDAIAAESVIFDRAVTPSPVCVPARLSLLSGQYANRHGNSNNNPGLSYSGRGFYSMLTEAGFDSCCVGKMHHVWDRYGSLGFSRRDTQEEMSHPKDDYTKYIEENYPYVFDYNGQRSEMYYVPQVSQLPAEAHPTQWIGDRTVEFIENCDPEKPVFLMSSFIHPHPPFCPPAPWNKLYRSDELPAPFVPDDTRELKPLLHKTFDADRLGISDLDALKLKNFYYACVSFVDYQISRITDALRRRGRYDDTAILFISDHGECLGDYRNMGKRTMLSSASAIPFMLRVPGMPAGRRSDPVSLVDVAPTLLSLAGVHYDPAEFDGIDLFTGKHDIVYSQYNCHEKGVYMAAGETDKLIWHGPRRQYYYFESSPETHDLYPSLCDSARVRFLKEKLDAYVAADTGKPDAPVSGESSGWRPPFGVSRMDHTTRRAEEAARIPEGYRIDLRRPSDKEIF